MKRTLLAIASLGLLLGAVPLAGSATTPTPAAPVAFGMEASSIGRQANAGVKADYGTFWIGPWTLSSGWAGPDARMAEMNAAGVTPAIHFYYWGDDISPSCVENGCWSDLHDAQKTRAGWERLGQQLADHMNAKMGGKPVVVFLESEFNKGGIEKYEPFDGYMADMAAFLREKYPAVQIVLGFGNWGSVYWGTFDRAAAASDMTGIQGMRGSTRQTLEQYGSLYEGLQTGANKLKTLFGKPIMLTDIALSSYPEPQWLKPQADTLQEVFDHLPELKAAGVQAIIYRSWMDSPGMDLANYYGMAERYWGLANKSGLKPAAQVWIDGVKAERASAAPAPAPQPVPTPEPEPTPFNASFAPSKGSNEWWVDVKVTGTGTVASVSATVNGGVPHALSKTRWGTWADSFHAPKGSSVVFTAKDPSGASVASKPIAWLMPAGTQPTAPAPPAPAFNASFTPSSNVNAWWVDVKVTSTGTVAGVSAAVNGGAPKALAKTSWGTWAASFSVPKGSTVVFTAKDPSGATATSAPIAWLAPTGTTPAPAPGMTATFTPKTLTNHWWVETGVSASAPLSKVEVKLNNGAWTALPKTSWGTYAKSLSVPAGTQIVFRATSTTGAIATSGVFVEK